MLAIQRFKAIRFMKDLKEEYEGFDLELVGKHKSKKPP